MKRKKHRENDSCGLSASHSSLCCVICYCLLKCEAECLADEWHRLKVEWNDETKTNRCRYMLEWSYPEWTNALYCHVLCRVVSCCVVSCSRERERERWGERVLFELYTHTHTHQRAVVTTAAATTTVMMMLTMMTRRSWISTDMIVRACFAALCALNRNIF